MSSFIAPIVGAHFRPPAKAVLAALPNEQTLVLEREPENPYDVNAVKVCVDSAAIPASCDEDLALTLPQYGCDVEALRAQQRWHLGYIDSKKTGAAAVISKAMAEAEAAGHIVECRLTFSLDGSPAAQILNWSVACVILTE